MAKKFHAALDIETYRNYFLVVAKSHDNRKYVFEMHNDQVTQGSLERLEQIIRNSTLITFNGIHYDIPVVIAALKGYSNRRLKDMSDKIIKKNINWWQFSEYFPDLLIPPLDHIDLIGATPLQASLKTYACRIHASTLKDLPIHPDAKISEAGAAELRYYCENDVDLTWLVYDTVFKDLELRQQMGRQYGQDFRSKSGPRIAEAVIKHQMQENGHKVTKRNSHVEPFKYKMPDFIRFNTQTLQTLQQAVTNAVFEVNDNGYVELPMVLNQAVEFDGAFYKMGIGGLHSQEKHQAIVAAEGQMLGELDVASMYPSIILGQNLYPKHLGAGFVDVYREIFNTRIAAKKAGNKIKSDSLKLVLNSSYGKFGNRYSFLYSPELLIQTTITGQLALLMLIEDLSGLAKVVSANTDGVVILFAREDKKAVDRIAAKWVKRTTYQLEWTPYKALYSESVNSYIALKPGGGSKRKGLYAGGSISKGYSNEICVDAVVEYLENGTPIEHTIYSCSDIRAFLTMRGVRGGAKWRGEDLGKVVRWYVGHGGEPILYIKNDNKVAGSDGAIPMMVLGDLPQDIDYEFYIAKSLKTLEKLGVEYNLD
jgi:hypothetical protein